MYRTIFLKENEKDVFGVLQEQGIDVKVFEHHLAGFFNRVYNNYVGYYVFKQNEVIYKLIVLPKTIQESISAEKEFVNYLLHYYRVNNIYKFDKEKKIPNSLLQLAFKSNSGEKNSHNLLDEFQSYKYKAILQSIESFFKRHKNSKRIKINYVSQSIKHKLNLKRNIKELDKTKIHQIQSKDVVFSMLATVTYNALKLFLAHKLENINEKYKNELFREVKKLKNFLLKKYNIEKGYKLTLTYLQGVKLEKLFSKTEENKQLLVDIKSLFGFEQMYKDNAISVDHKNDLTTTSLFINPIIFYEWYVYDVLTNYADASGKSILFDKKEGTGTKYYLNSKEKSSNPDYILTDEVNKVKIVIDAKWKNVNEFGDIKPSDYLKLKFDVSLLKSKGYGVGSYLIYPNINIQLENNFSMLVDDKSIFNFNTIVIDMEFEKYSNNLDFDFNIDKISKSIEAEGNKEAVRQLAIKSTLDIQPQRNKIIQQLIDSESTEEKEKLGGLFDNTLWEKSVSLVKSLNTEIILEEVEEILNEFDTIMEKESITFIKSTSTIYAHYKDEESITFDFSMPGSGLWKLIEVELNTSFIWQLRILSKVCDNQNSWNKFCKRNAKIYQDLDNGKKVFLSMSDKKDKSKLQSVTLGGISLLLEDKSTLDEFNTYFLEYKEDFDFIQNVLPSIILKVTTFRNEHAHIKAMSKDIFEELWGLLFEKDTTGKNQLQKLLIFKKNMKVYINE